MFFPWWGVIRKVENAHVQGDRDPGSDRIFFVSLRRNCGQKAEK